MKVARGNPRSEQRDDECDREREKARRLVNLGLRYAFGRGVRRDRQRANALYREAAALGSPAAMHNLGTVYREGRGVRRSPSRAFAWFAAAAAAGDRDGCYRALDLVEDGVLRRPLAPLLRCLRAIAEAGDADAQVTYGVHCFEGRGVKKDWRQALLWYRRAARQGDRVAFFNLAQMHRCGDGVRQSWPQALTLYRRAAALGHVGSAHWLARWYDGLERAPARTALAVKWLRIAARRGDPQSLRHLGVRHFQGNGVRKDRRRAAELYRRAAAGGDAWASYLLGLCHRDGHGVRRDRPRARVLWRTAAKAGVREAHRLLDRLRRAR